MNRSTLQAVGRVALNPVLVVACRLYPVAVVGSYYLVWAVAWVVLDHRPRPLIDDPKYIGTVVDVPLAASGVMTVASPAVLAVSLAAPALGHAFRQGPPWIRLWRALGDIGVLGLIWSAALGWLRVDPGGVFEWYFD